jgi:hypothetical protein
MSYLPDSGQFYVIKLLKPTYNRPENLPERYLPQGHLNVFHHCIFELADTQCIQLQVEIPANGIEFDTVSGWCRCSGNPENN